MDPIRAPLLKRLRPAHWVAIDCAVTALLALVSTVVFKEAAYLRGIPHWAAAAIIAIGVLPGAFRRRWPAAVLALVVASAAVATAISTSPGPALVVVFVIYVIPLRFARREALWLLAGTLLVTGAGLAAFAGGPHVTDLSGTAVGLLLASELLITTAWLIGYSVRQQRSYAAGLREQSERRAREQLAEAGRARSEERLQIARELHDVVAHTMSLIAVQAGVANYVASARPDVAIRALSSIEETSRGALGEMRALLGVLRADGNGTDGNGALGLPDGGLVPTPGLTDLDSLVKRTADAGVRVDLHVCGERPRLAAGLDLAAYRVIQEAITNVIKHATTDSCQVTVGYQEDTLTLEVTDAGCGGGSGLGASELGASELGGSGLGAGHRGAGHRGMTIRVLVADDQALVRGSFRILVDTAPDLASVGEAATGTQAVELARRVKPDVVLMDIRMPGMDGIAATRQITAAAETSAVRVLILTTFDLDEYVFGALRAGASGFLLKDTPPAELLGRDPRRRGRRRAAVPRRHPAPDRRVRRTPRAPAARGGDPG